MTKEYNYFRLFKCLIFAKSFNSFNIPKNALDKISDIIKKKIILYTHYNREKFELIKQVYGKKYEETIEIAIYKEHYFKYEKTLYSKFFIDNYEKLNLVIIIYEYFLLKTYKEADYFLFISDCF